MTIHQPDLDIYASNVTPAVKVRHGLRVKSGELLGGRVSFCGRKRITNDVTICRHESGSAYYGGLATCGSIWKCPVCASKIQAKRAEDVDALVTAHQENGGAVLMMTGTVPHGAQQSLRRVLDGVTQSWRAFLNGAPWKRIRQEYEIAGYVRAIEVTHGKNGWHPHIHALLFLENDLTELELDLFRLRLLTRWRAMVKRQGLGNVSDDAFDLRWINPTTDKAAAYIVKWGAGAEISAAATKTGREGNRSPWQLLADADRGDLIAGGLWRTFGNTMEGRRHLTWSRGIREMYGLRDEVSDQEAAEDGGETLELEGLADGMKHGRLGLIDPDSWATIVKDGLTADCLLMIGKGASYDDLVFWLKDRHGISISANQKKVPGKVQNVSGVARWAQGLPQKAPPPTITEKRLGGLISDVQFKKFLAATPEDVAAARATLQRQSVGRVFQQMRVK